MRRLSTLGPLLLVCSCFGAKDSALFVDAAGGSAGALSSSAGSSAVAHSGTDSGSGAGASAPAGGSGVAAAGSALNGGGGSGAGGSGASGAGEASATGGQGSPAPVVESCSMVQGAVESELDGHCYRVNNQELSFADAHQVCVQAGGHLVNIGSVEENAWVAELHDGEHWIGASDGRADDVAGVGPYTWQNGEPWSYSDWEEGQPNAFETDCPSDDDEADCYEHCAFQSDEGDWNDRSCWHTIASVCEWDVAKPDAAVGGSGPADEP